MKIAYQAFNSSGKSVSDLIDATSLTDAREALRKQGLFVTEVREHDVQGKTQARARAGRRSGRGARLREVALFVRQLSVLVSTGTPLVEALTALERQEPAGRFHTVIADIRQRVEEGNALSSALEAHPGYFDSVALSLIAAGETGGKLDAMLRKLSTLTRQQMKIRSSIVGAMVYPALLTSISMGVLNVMLFFVLPRFQGLFETLGSPLPASTRLLVDFSTLLRTYWWAALIVVVGSVVGARLYLATSRGRDLLHRAFVRAPQLGRVVRAFATARIARVLGVLVEGRVPLLEALKLTRESSGNSCYERLVARAEDFVTRGESISQALEGSPLVPRALTEAIRSGERSGQLGTVLIDIADFLDEDNEIILRSLSSIIEPLILIVLGVVVGFVAISMFLPLFDLATAAQSGAH